MHHIFKIASSEIVIINVIEDNGRLAKALPLTIKANLIAESIKVEKIKEQIDKTESHPEAVLEEQLQNIIKEITTACKNADITKQITYKIGSRDPADEIIEASKLMHFDLIIIGSRKIASMIEGIGSLLEKLHQQ